MKLLLSPLVFVALFACAEDPASVPDVDVDDATAIDGAVEVLPDVVADSVELEADTAPLPTCELEGGLFMEDDAPFGLIHDSEALWWTALDESGGRALRQLATGMTAATTLYTRDSGMLAVGVERGVVYFTDPAAASVYAWDPIGGERRIASGLANLDGTAIAAHEGAVYVIVHDEDAAGFVHRLYRVPASGGAPEALGDVAIGMADGDLTAPIQVGAQGLHWTTVMGDLVHFELPEPEPAQGPQVRMRVDDGIRAWHVAPTLEGDEVWFVRWSDATDIEVLRANASEPERVLTAAAAQMAIHFHDGVVYWPRRDGLYGLDTNVDEAVPFLVAEADTSSVTALVSDGERIVWANSAMGDFGGGLGHACLGVPAVVPVTWRASLETAGPIGVGAQTLTLVIAAEGAPGVYPTDVSVDAWMPAHGHGAPTPPTTRALGEGRYEVDVTLSMPGRWELRIDADDARVVIALDVVASR
jgi:hypothetical protein